MSHSNPLVTIWCPTYNHENYIKECLNGFLMQKTKFPIEILVHDDASVDKTASIIKEFVSENPKLFRCIYELENQFRKYNNLTNILMKWARGKYIAMCEGDDYWTDPLKLQKQVDFLEAHPGCSGCFHAARYQWEAEGSGPEIYSPSVIKAQYTHRDFLQRNCAATASLVLRRSALGPPPKWLASAACGDLFLTGLCMRNGDLGYMNEVMSVYRIHPGGIYRKQSYRQRIKQWADMQAMYVHKLAPQLKGELKKYKAQNINELVNMGFYELQRGNYRDARLCMRDAMRISFSIALKAYFQRLGWKYWLPRLFFARWFSRKKLPPSE